MTLDDAYAFLQPYGPEYSPIDLSNHAPMAVEAAAALGRSAEIVPWLERYAQLLRPQPAASAPIDPDNWQGALAGGDRYADWVAFFEAEFRRPAWTDVVDRWAARLAPGMIGAAMHGLLRAAHAARAVATRDTEVRRRELAQGFAYWATRFHRLPEAPAPAGRADDASLLARIALLPDDQRRNAGLISDAVVELERFTPFHSVIARLDVAGAAPAAVLSDLTAAFAGGYLANATPEALIAVIHMLTGPAAVRLLLPHVSDATARSLLRYAWQAGAALFAVYGTAAGTPAIERDPPDGEQLVDRALASYDEHAIKFTEACLREDAVRPNPVYRSAAADALRRFADRS